MKNKKHQQLREGFTTGTAASAAAKAAVMFLRGIFLSSDGVSPGHTCCVEVPLPNGERMRISVKSVNEADNPGHEGYLWAVASVVKDAGDDPDVTHKAEIRARVGLFSGAAMPGVSIDGGSGVGRATLPGLPVKPGEAAINPVPMEQIRLSVLEALGETATTSHVRIVIEVPEGERLALRTYNPRLGIVGGISILGTRGTVKPLSHEAYRATISAALSVAEACGLREIYFSTGGRSERFLKARFGYADTTQFVLAGDYFGHAMRRADEMGFMVIRWGLFFGKLLKISQWLENTHVKSGETDFRRLAAICLQCGMSPEDCAAVSGVITAAHGLEIIRRSGCEGKVFAEIFRLAFEFARSLTGADTRTEFYLFDFNGSLLYPIAG